ncbi:MAG: M23 family metallopeptidase [Rickettsiales bacterium]|jgi:murein DD-endopeptidase MepM/ murein hydrolase activator NlpD|nr:M23 family metallopeptidase [Rickettsiales bacterium]
MNQKRTIESTLNLLVPYLFGLSLFIFFIAAGYKLWLAQHEVSNRGFAVQYEEPSMSAEEEGLNSNSKNPEFILNEGETLGSILDQANISNNDAAAIIEAFSKKYNPRKLKAGTVVEFSFEKGRDGASLFNNMLVNISNVKKISVSLNSNNEFLAYELTIPLVKQVVHHKSVIKNSIIGTALEMSIPSNTIMSMIRAFSYDVDFQRDIKNGDQLEVVVEKFYTEDGKLSHTGNILYSSLVLRNKKVSIYHFVHPDGQVSYYNEKGESIKKEFLRTPINAARISSKFGMRNHPVHGYSKMHKGVDFAAPTGTPILAAGSGVVELATNLKGYGKYIRIKHNGTYSTAYGHASRFAKGIKPGTKVTQGQVIAYVGSTGVTSGPHLHYEVLENGKQINPLKFKFASNNEKLAGKPLELFRQNKKKIDEQLSQS